MSAIRPMRRQLWLRIGRKGVRQRLLLDGMVDHVPIDSNAGIATRVLMSGLLAKAKPLGASAQNMTEG